MPIPLTAAPGADGEGEEAAEGGEAKERVGIPTAREGALMERVDELEMQVRRHKQTQTHTHAHNAHLHVHVHVCVCVLVRFQYLCACVRVCRQAVMFAGARAGARARRDRG